MWREHWLSDPPATLRVERRRGNKFWKVLYECGLTGERLQPADYLRVLEWNIGLTDLCKGQSGMDRGVKVTKKDRDILREKIERCQPKILAFNGKKSAKKFLKLRQVEYGEYHGDHGFSRTRIWVLPSTSPAGARYWDEKPWRSLAAIVRE